MKLNGIADLFIFLEALRQRKIHFFIEQYRPDSVTVTFTIIQYRVEVDFFADHIEYSYFVGNEDVLSSEDILQAFINHDYNALERLGVRMA